jgi:hypothetical protein
MASAFVAQPNSERDEGRPVHCGPQLIVQGTIREYQVAKALQVLPFIGSFHAISRRMLNCHSPHCKSRLPIVPGACDGCLATWQFGEDLLPIHPIATMSPTSKLELTDKIVAFLRDIGLPIQPNPIIGDTILPGIKVEHGVLIYDPNRLEFPGDLLHEAGHLAVKPPADRKRAGENLGADPAEEMMAIGWSYAAILHLELPPEVVFHPAGYRGGSQSLLENFYAGRYLAVPMLQWVGMTHDDNQARSLGAEPYPKMRAWLRPS